MGAGILKAVVAITLVTCVVVIVVSPFVDLPLTVQNTKAHVTLHVVQTSVPLDSQLQAQVLSPAIEPLGLATETDKLDILVTYRC
jgi:hypothetical protein